ncbi:hypothetical protein [Hydrocarboniphaga sp.]|uniref:hypothetical protein n=1 Tax=Hydrocarboniphaga sp. TaxID=2033016 RepID=UPI003D130C9B
MKTLRPTKPTLAATLFLMLGAAVAPGNIAHAATVITKSEQSAVVAEAKVQRRKLLEAERRLRLSDFDDAYQSELAGFGYRWTNLDASGVAKDAFRSCSTALADVTSLMVNRSGSEDWQTYDAKKRIDLAEDRAQCDRALSDPEIAFRAQKVRVVDLIVE